MTQKDNQPIVYEQPPLTIDERVAKIRQHLQELHHKKNENMGLFLVKDGNTWLKEASLRPMPGKLFSEFWHKGELCILFADTNVGKSILAVQIADSISRGIPIPGFTLDEPAQPTIYFDFELIDKQFEIRYSNNGHNHYAFAPFFYRAEINPETEVPDYEDSFEHYLNQSLERTILETGARVLVIDNITYLKNETERAKDALPLMKHLMALKKKHGLSILALAHTPKRDMTQPITGNHLQGSRMLLNFCDSCFCIGVSRHDKGLRYLKQIKMRATEGIYDSENVCLCMIDKPANFLQFSFINYGAEKEHLAEMSEENKNSQKERIMELKAEGKTYEQISKIIGISPATISRIINK